MSNDTEGELISEVVDGTTLSLIQQAELDTQISTAKRYPRSIRRFMDETKSVVTLSEEIAGECMYALPRGGKTIEGPSARFAEVIASTWGNCRAGARVVAVDDKFITAQGAFHDLERNVAITYEVKRRITDKSNRRYNDDMIAVTGNAASSIALRNAVLKGIPKAFWKGMYDEARRCAVGDVTTLPNKRASALANFAKMGVTEAMILKLLQFKGVEDIDLDGLATLRGLFVALRDGETTVEQVFDAAPAGTKVQDSALNKKLENKKSKGVKYDPQQSEDSAAYSKRLRKELAIAASADAVNEIMGIAIGHEGSAITTDDLEPLTKAATERVKQIEATSKSGNLL